MSAAQIAVFGTTSLGVKVERVTIAQDGLSASILTKGATLQSVRLAGVAHGLGGVSGARFFAPVLPEMRLLVELTAAGTNVYEGRLTSGETLLTTFTLHTQ